MIEPPLRHHTAAAIDFISHQLGLRNEPGMQDWAFEESDFDLGTNPEWSAFLARLVENIETHGSQIWYWASWDVELEDAWRVAPFMRKMCETHFSSQEQS